MSEGAVAVSTQAPASTPAPEQIDTGEMTPGERAYFQSRGQDVSGLGLPNGAQTATAAPQAATADPATQMPATPGTPASDDAEPGEITIDANGQARDAKTGRFIPKEVALRWKGEAKEAKTEAQTLREKLAVTQERLAILTEVLPKAEQPTTQKTPDADAPPDPEVDVLGFMKWQAKKIAELEGKLTQTATETKQTLEQQQVKEAFTSDVKRFAAQQPDFMPALQHAIGVRDKMLEAFGHSDPAQRQAMIMAEIADIAKAAVANKFSPAERLYAVAKALGYTPRPAQSEEDAKKAAALAELERIQKGQQASASLRGAGAPGVAATIGPAEWAAMDEDKSTAFRRDYIAKHGQDAWREFLAGRR